MKKSTNGHNKNIFLDTDVLISSILSSRGASYWLIHKTENLNLYTNSETLEELNKVVTRNKLTADKIYLEKLIVNTDRTEYSDFQSLLNDRNDEHILRGAVNSNSEYLVTFNKKDYKIDLIRATFNIITLSPGEFLQYLRSLN
ncbi:PIN domain-containing protein [Candidatus Dojkabacteria bacterium]|nr:PIN domain-containing protein [Candidatus Dojkabacteria bacterium]